MFYLLAAWLTRVTVVLVDDYGVLYILHVDVPEVDVFGISFSSLHNRKQFCE